MDKQQKEVNQAWHLMGMTVAQIAEQHNIEQEQVCNLIVTWERYYGEIVK